MSERYAKVVYGEYIKNLPPCSYEDGWAEWVYTVALPASLGPGPRRSINDVRFVSSYESIPGWMGFEIAALEYMETLHLPKEVHTLPAVEAWGQLDALVRQELQLKLGWGRIIIAMDR